MLAFALRADEWYLRQDIIWAKPNPMPESVRDRCTKAHEYIFLLSKSPHYYFDAEAIKEPCVQDEIANGFRGGAYCGNKTFDNSAGGGAIERIMEISNQRGTVARSIPKTRTCFSG